MRPTPSSLDSRWRRFASPEWLASWSPRVVALADGDTEVVEHGTGPPLLLVPPLPGYKEAYAALLPLLAKHFRVVTCDVRGHFTTRPRMTQAVADLARVADSLGLDRFALFGHSLGGAIAQRFALAHPDRVRALVLSSSFAWVSTPAGAAVARWLEQPLVLAALRLLPERQAIGLALALAARRRWVFDPACDERVCALVTHGVKRVSLSRVREQVALALEHDLRRVGATLAVPALLVRGEADAAFVVEQERHLAMLIPGVASAQSPGVGHLHPLSNPEWLAATITRWLEALPGS